MDEPSTLVCWIGHTDLWAMARERRELIEEVRRQTKQDEPRRDPGLGPVKTLTSQRTFDRVNLISNYSETINEAISRWLAAPVTVHFKALEDPTDYESVFRITNEVLERVSIENRREGRRLAIHLSPGTPTMAAILILLGKTRFFPAKLYQTHGGTVFEAKIPFELDLFVSKLLEDPDNLIHNLSFEQPSEVRGFEWIIGRSTGIKVAVERAKRAAIRHYNVLLMGESGTGKELFARAIHAASPRREKPFVPINCAVLPEHLRESELFGHVKGAFSGANQDRVGAFEAANGGSLFLDEVGECDLPLQAKLLRVLQPPPDRGPCYREYQRVGESATRASEVRVVAATNRALLEGVRDHRFREDLYNRLATLVIRIPPLRERQTDIRLLADDTLTRINRELGDTEPGYRERRLSEQAYRKLTGYDWPGNIRQLKNVLIQAAVMANAEVIGVRDVEAAIAESPELAACPSLSLGREDGFELDRRLAAIERQFIEDALKEAGWPQSHGSKARTARLLGLKSQQDLAKRMKRLGIEDDGSVARSTN